MAKTKKTDNEGADFLDIGLKTAAYVGKNMDKKRIDSELKKLRVILEEYLEANYKESDKGHKYAIVSHAGESFEIKHQKRVSAVAIPDAIAVLKKNTPKEVYNKCVETVEVLRADVIESLHKAKVIDDTLLTKLYESVVSYSFLVTKIDTKDEDI